MELDKILAKYIKNGAVGIMPTDTILGLVGSALLSKTAKKIYGLKDRPADMPFIVLISRLSDLNKLGIEIGTKEKKILKNNWPNSISFILPCPSAKFKYLHRGTKTLAIRYPNDQGLTDLIKKTGPLIATSANIHDEPAAKNITQAKKYFSDKVDFYLNGKSKSSKPSTLVKLSDGKVEIIRQGSVRVKRPSEPKVYKAKSP
jgi:L-threonylcarbamoyladenylate synthase